MKGKYITTDILMACLSKPAHKKKDIHAQLEETIAERKRIMLRMEHTIKAARVIDMYLSDTIAA
jgi:hypothetical protein